ncbi:hypothetical protein V6U71_07135 [Sphingopyxis sp. J-6]|uniref:hypothetical protein n=1 Tax=Sphingopyxis sp. J-6 TaxID=3122054 RepID=UPI003983FF44
MLSNAPIHGLDLLARMAAAAADRAAARLCGAIRLADCQSIALAEDLDAADLAIESWAVRADEGRAVIAVFATTPQADGRRRIAASGRFTFAALT